MFHLQPVWSVTVTVYDIYIYRYILSFLVVVSYASMLGLIHNDHVKISVSQIPTTYFDNRHFTKLLFLYIFYRQHRGRHEHVTVGVRGGAGSRGPAPSTSAAATPFQDGDEREQRGEQVVR